MPNNRAEMTFVGDIELVEKLEQLKADVPKAIAKALKKSMQIPTNEMLTFMAQHHRSGRTEASFEFTEPVTKNTAKGTQVIAELGFNVAKGGLPAIFLNLGGMHNPPYFFIKKAVDNNIDAIKKAQEDALREVIRDVE